MQPHKNNTILVYMILNSKGNLTGCGRYGYSLVSILGRWDLDDIGRHIPFFFFFLFTTSLRTFLLCLALYTKCLPFNMLSNCVFNLPIHAF